MDKYEWTFKLFNGKVAIKMFCSILKYIIYKCQKIKYFWFSINHKFKCSKKNKNKNRYELLLQGYSLYNSL